MDLKPEDDPIVVVLHANEILRTKLTTAVEKMKRVKILLDENKFDEAIELRGRSFQSNFENFKILTRLEPKKLADDARVRTSSIIHSILWHISKYISHFQEQRNFAVLQIGTPVCGMNASLFSFVRNCLDHGGKVYGIFGGIEGFLEGQVSD